MVVVFRKANWRDERVIPKVKRAKRAALGRWRGGLVGLIVAEEIVGLQC